MIKIVALAALLAVAYSQTTRRDNTININDLRRLQSEQCNQLTDVGHDVVLGNDESASQVQAVRSGGTNEKIQSIQKEQYNTASCNSNIGNTQFQNQDAA